MDGGLLCFLGASLCGRGIDSLVSSWGLVGLQVCLGGGFWGFWWVWGFWFWMPQLAVWFYGGFPVEFSFVRGWYNIGS